jgi:hypothetical protein
LAVAPELSRLTFHSEPLPEPLVSLSSVRLHRLLLVASLLVPALVFVAAAAWNRLEVLRENDETITRTAAILHEHAHKVFDSRFGDRAG